MTNLVRLEASDINELCHEKSFENQQNELVLAASSGPISAMVMWHGRGRPPEVGGFPQLPGESVVVTENLL